MSQQTAIEEPRNAIAKVDPPPASENGKGDASAKTLDLDGYITFPVTLGRQEFIAREVSIEDNENVVRETPLPPVDPEKTSLTDAVLDELRKLDVEDRIRRLLTLLDDDNKLTLHNFETMIPQARAVLVHADGENEGQPPTPEFLRTHLRISTFGRLMKQLGLSGDDEDKEAEGKSLSG